jgi:hypothetical protein
MSIKHTLDRIPISLRLTLRETFHVYFTDHWSRRRRLLVSSFEHRQNPTPRDVPVFLSNR